MTSVRELERSYPGPKVVLATDSSLSCGLSKALLLRWGGDPRCRVIFIDSSDAKSLASELRGERRLLYRTKSHAMPYHTRKQSTISCHRTKCHAMPWHTILCYMSHRALDGDVILSAAELDRPMNRGFVSGQCVSRTMSRQANAMQPSQYQ